MRFAIVYQLCKLAAKVRIFSDTDAFFFVCFCFSYFSRLLIFVANSFVLKVISLAESSNYACKNTPIPPLTAGLNKVQIATDWQLVIYTNPEKNIFG